MSGFQAFNPTSPITTEAQAEAAARSSAVAMFIGAVVGVASVVWNVANPQDIQAAVSAASAAEPGGAATAAAGAQVGLYMAGGLAVVQAILGFVQWRNPGKFLAWLFIVLVLFGIVSSAATPLLTASMPNIPHVPAWQIALSIAVMVVQSVLLFAGLRGIGKLDALQMEASR